MYRLFSISQHVPSKPYKITAKELQEELAKKGIEISLRTVQRDLEMMSSMGMFNIVSDNRNKPHGWYVKCKCFCHETS